MKKHKISAFMALIILFSCTKEQLKNNDPGSLKSEQSTPYVLNGEQQAKTPNGTYSIAFYSNSIADGVFLNNCVPQGYRLLKNGKFSGNIIGFGKINPRLSKYEFVSCEKLPINPPNIGEPDMYAIVAVGKLALSTSDQCTITIRGNIYPWYYTEFGFYGGNFIGSAITESGTGKLKGLNNKRYEVYNGNMNGPGINLETGPITLRISEMR